MVYIMLWVGWPGVTFALDTYYALVLIVYTDIHISIIGYMDVNIQ